MRHHAARESTGIAGFERLPKSQQKLFRERSMATSSAHAQDISFSDLTVRRVIEVRGIVQGVGFRPLVFALACELRLSGFVRNVDGLVRIELQGSRENIDHFVHRLTVRPPPRAKIEQVDMSEQTTIDEIGFVIADSHCEKSQDIMISADIATCAECLRELADPEDRRFEYAFLNCTHCGPRLTIVEAAPYDRIRTTMSRFEMCADCRREYAEPLDRRFHAQPVACPVCGPKLRFVRPDNERSAIGSPLAETASALRRGEIVAVKGLGGYHLACDAQNSAAVQEIRRRKLRDERPFALMLSDLRAVEQICVVTARERTELMSPRRPIVLLRRHSRVPSEWELAPEVVFGNPRLGIMLPYSPLHHLLLAKIDGMPLVMTSANRADQPIIFDDDMAAGSLLHQRHAPGVPPFAADTVSGSQDCQRQLESDQGLSSALVTQLPEMADAILTHDRPIQIRCDDSVIQVVDQRVSVLRRSRGYAPEPLRLPIRLREPTLALGGQQKNTIALGKERHAVLSHHLGDLDDLHSFLSFRETIEHYSRLFCITPCWFIHDLHPDYASTLCALQLASVANPPTEVLAVQHHHAHLASCMAEHDLQKPVIGVIFDGSGWGSDGTIWGGEILIGGYDEFRRAAHLRPVRMVGGEQAIRDPWRMAVSCLLDADVDPTGVMPPQAVGSLANIRRMIERGINSPLTSSAGRLFDAVAAMADVRRSASYEGQAAIELEWLANDIEPDGTYPFQLTESRATKGAVEIDTRPMISAGWQDIVDRIDRRIVSRRFHSTLVAITIRCCQIIREASGLSQVVLSGGVFQNAILSSEVLHGLEAAGFQVYCHQLVPCNDGGLSLGQLAIAAAFQAKG